MSDKPKILVLVLLNVVLILLYLSTPKKCPPNYVSENLAQYRSIAENLILVRDSLAKDYHSKDPLYGNSINVRLNKKVLEEMNRKPDYYNILSKVNSKMNLSGFTLTADNKVFLHLNDCGNFFLGERTFETLIYSNRNIHQDLEENSEVKETCHVQLDKVMLYRREKVND
ncbi:MAG: hypothetical protein IPH31_19180 [Lewinellaceae bacterium]|nr:hypothetical protein [Lewinellaceae bacterium]